MIREDVTDIINDFYTTLQEHFTDTRSLAYYLDPEDLIKKCVSDLKTLFEYELDEHERLVVAMIKSRF